MVPMTVPREVIVWVVVVTEGVVGVRGVKVVQEVAIARVCE